MATYQHKSYDQSIKLILRARYSKGFADWKGVYGVNKLDDIKFVREIDPIEIAIEQAVKELKGESC